MGLTDDDLPLVTGQRGDMALAIHRFGGPGTAKDKCAGITRIMEDSQDIMMLQIAPDKFALVRPAPYAPRKRDMVLAEGADSPRG
jgi:hypothetical protein